MGATFSFQERLGRQNDRYAKTDDEEVREELVKVLNFIRASGKDLRIADGFEDWATLEALYPGDKWDVVQGRSLSKLEFRNDCPPNERYLLTFEVAGCDRPGDF